jgi:hypothetical protein
VEQEDRTAALAVIVVPTIYYNYPLMRFFYSKYRAIYIFFAPNTVQFCAKYSAFLQRAAKSIAAGCSPLPYSKQS